MRKLILSLMATVCCALLVGCFLHQQPQPQPHPQPRIVNLTSPFDAVKARELSQGKGKNTIEGSALMRRDGGGVVTCAGLEVRLVPVTAYASERIQAIYGNTQRGTVAFSVLPQTVEFMPDIPEYRTFTKTNRCDTKGYFKFEEIPDGEYYLTVVIAWKTNYLQGGTLMQRVEVKNGQTVGVILAPLFAGQ